MVESTTYMQNDYHLDQLTENSSLSSTGFLSEPFDRAKQFAYTASVCAPVVFALIISPPTAPLAHYSLQIARIECPDKAATAPFSHEIAVGNWTQQCRDEVDYCCENNISKLLQIIDAPETQESIKSYALERSSFLLDTAWRTRLTPRLMMALGASSFVIRSSAILALSRIIYEPIIKQEVEFISHNDPSSFVREAALDALALAD